MRSVAMQGDRMCRNGRGEACLALDGSYGATSDLAQKFEMQTLGVETPHLYATALVDPGRDLTIVILSAAILRRAKDLCLRCVFDFANSNTLRVRDPSLRRSTGCVQDDIQTRWRRVQPDARPPRYALRPQVCIRMKLVTVVSGFPTCCSASTIDWSSSSAVRRSLPTI